jgi:ribonucleotide reductase alpha subunit
VKAPFTPEAMLDAEALERLVPLAVRMMDNVIDVSRFPLPQQEKEAKAKRRIGLGVTGLADALIFCGVRYGARGGAADREWLGAVQRLAYMASADTRGREGRFPLFERGSIWPARRSRLYPRKPAPRSAARHPQRAPDLDRAHRHDLAVGRQRLLRYRAGLCLQLCAPRAAAGWFQARGERRRLRLSVSGAS